MATRKKNEPLGAEAQPFAELMQQMTHLPQISPATLAELQADYLKQAAALWNSSLGQGEAPAVSDRRFSSPEWRANPAASFMTQLYLLNGRTLQQMAAAVEADDKTRARIKFAVQQFVDAASPSNYLATNPEPRWRIDLALLAREALQAAGVAQISGGGWCTLTEDSRFFSFRGEALGRPRGRMAACISLR